MIRLFINSMVSERAQMMTLDIRNFYLGTPMTEPVYMFIIPQTFIDKYNLRDIVENGMFIHYIWSQESWKAVSGPTSSPSIRVWLQAVSFHSVPVHS